MAVVDARYRFLFVDISQPGGDSVGGIWSNTDISYAVDYDEAGFPPNRKLPGNEDDPNAPELPIFIVGNDAFGLKPWLMKPYPFHRIDNKQRVFNYRLSRACRVVENVFGILVMRFRYLRRPMEQNVAIVN